MKTINIEIPKGHEIDQEKSNLSEGKIVFKQIKKALPKTWEELGRVRGYWIDEFCKLGTADCNAKFGTRHIFATKELAEASIALAQLSQLREVYRNGWEPNWEDGNPKYLIALKKNKFDIDFYYTSPQFLSFQSPEIRDEFLKNFRDLIEIAKPLMS